jgi:hypothetical protein
VSRLDQSEPSHEARGFPRAPWRRHDVEVVVELGEDRVDHDPDAADRMISWDQIPRLQRREHRHLRIRSSTHHPSMTNPDRNREHRSGLFSAPC